MGLGLNIYKLDGDSHSFVDMWNNSNLGVHGADALSWLIGDIDGDGQAELLQPWRNHNGKLGLEVYSWVPGNRPASPGHPPNPPYCHMKRKWNTSNLDDQGADALSWLIGDIDGDGKAELLQPWRNHGGNLGLEVYNWIPGNEPAPIGHAPTPPPYCHMTTMWGTSDMSEGAGADSWLVGDIDGDGKAELLQPWKNGERLGLIVYKWDGSNMIVLDGSGGIMEYHHPNKWFIADIDNDGHQELIQIWNNNKFWSWAIYKWVDNHMKNVGQGDLDRYPFYETRSLLIGDLDGTGYAKLLMLHNYGGNLGLIVFNWWCDGLTPDYKILPLTSYEQMEGNPDAPTWLIADVVHNGMGALLQLWREDDCLKLIEYNWDQSGGKSSRDFGNICMNFHPALSWLAGDIDGDGKEELLQPWVSPTRVRSRK